MLPAWNHVFMCSRGAGIRTPDLLLPKQARYQAALHPVSMDTPTSNDGEGFIPPEATSVCPEGSGRIRIPRDISRAVIELLKMSVQVFERVAFLG